MSVETMARLFEAARTSSASRTRPATSTRVSQQRARHAATDFIQLSGEDATALAFNAAGGHGCISVTANVAPALCARVPGALASPATSQRALTVQDRLMPLHQALFIEPARAGANTPLSAARHDAAAEVRLPLVPVLPSRRQGRRCRSAMVACRLDQLSRRSGRWRKKRASGKIVADNRKARFNYEIERDLRGRHRADRHRGEVAARAARPRSPKPMPAIKGGELWLINAYIPEYLQASRFNHEPRGRASCCCTSARSTS